MYLYAFEGYYFFLKRSLHFTIHVIMLDIR